ncbi:MAG: type IV secretion system protein [Rhodocyclaceae bacterium]|nr:type IV secretion system protein [Rhodocyclaceae bacterium]
MVPKLQGAGINLLVGLGSIMMAWTILKAVLADEGFPKIFVDAIALGLQISIIAWIINDLVPLSSALLSGFDWVAAKLTGASDGANALASGMAGLMQVSQNIWESIGDGEGSPSAWDVAKSIATGGGSALILKMVTLVAVMLITVVTTAIFIISQVLAGLGIALAPIFLPFYILPVLSSLASGVVQFIFKAGVAKAVGVIMISFLVEMTAVLNRLSQTWSGMDGTLMDLTAATVTLFVAVVMLFLALQIPSIANGLLSGSVVGGLSIPRIPRPSAPKPSGGGGGGGKAPPAPKPAPPPAK